MYIYRACSDCGNGRVTGPCYLEEYLQKQRDLMKLPTIRRRRSSTDIKNNICKVEDGRYNNNSNVLQVSVV